MTTKFVRILGLLSLFCVFAQTIEPIVAFKYEKVEIADLDNEADEEEKKENSLEDKEVKLSNQLSSYKLQISTLKTMLNKHEGKAFHPYLSVFSPPPDLPKELA